jgi:uncharacterized protein YutE (UPF0331/DUF86 family)
MLNGIIVQKLQPLDEVLAELRSLENIDAGQLTADWRTQRAIERDLQVLVEVVIDVCQRLISQAGQTPATTGGDAVERCIQLGALSDDEAYRQMVRFRNFIVHRYDRIEGSILADVINQRLPDFERFKEDVLNYVQSH